MVVDFVPRETLDLQKFYSGLEKIGTSIQVGEGEGMYRMHIHVPTEKRYEPIDYVMSLGTITKIAMENLVAQMEAKGQKPSTARLELAHRRTGTDRSGIGLAGSGDLARFRQPGGGCNRRGRADDESVHERHPGRI